MSRSTIGGVVGAVIGFVVSGYNPQGAYWGWVIGSGVGALTDNTKTYGPRLQDASQQTSQDGTPRTYGYGTFPTTGVILWRDKRKEHEEEQGKGGPSQVSFTYTWSYAIGVCLGPINNYLIIKRNATVVYDTRSDAELLEVGYTSEEISKTRMAQAKWMENATLYFGTDDQMPDPTMQAVKGMNNVPAYRGYAYIVMAHDDVTNDGGAIPQYEFVVSQCGTTSEDAGAQPARFIGAGVTPVGEIATTRTLDQFAIVLGTDDANVGSTNTSVVLDVAVIGSSVFSLVSGGGPAAIFQADRSDLTVWNNVAAPSLGAGIHRIAAAGGAVFVTSGTVLSKWDGVTLTTTDFGTTLTGAAGDGDVLLVIGLYGNVWKSTDGGDSFAITETFTGWHLYSIAYDGLRFVVAGAVGALIGFSYSDDAAETWVSSSFNPGIALQPHGLIWCGESRWMMSLTGNVAANYFFASADNAVSFTAVTLPEDIRYAYPGSTAHDAAGGLTVVIGTNASDQRRCYSSSDLTVWADVDLSDTASRSIFSLYPTSAAVGYIPPDGSVEVPDAPGYYVDANGDVTGPSGTQTDRCRPLLSAIVTKQALKREITRIVTEELEDTYVDGFRVATQTSPLANIQALMSAYTFDGSDHDGQLWFLMRDRRPLTFVIVPDDLVEQAGDPIEWEITKENDLLRKVTVNYFDPKTNYAQTSQDWEMRSSTVKALAEGTFEMALTGTQDWAKRGAEKSGKIAWAERRETKLKVNLSHAARYTGEWGELVDVAGKSHIVRITNIHDEGMVREITVRKTRHSAYESLAEGVDSPLPTFPTGTTRGPSSSVVMNMPALRPEDDKAGVYWAATGLLSAWRGSALGMSRTTGTWETGPSMSQSCTMGRLIEPLPMASRYAFDTTNILKVKLSPFVPKTLETIGEDGVWRGGNAAAIVYPDGTVEIIQFATATLVAPKTYELTGLLRGRKDTVVGLHAAEAAFVLLDSALRFVAIRPDDIGKTLQFRAVSIGTDADATPEQPVTFTTIESLREWQPYNVVVTPDGLGGYCVEWIGRARLGSSRTPIHSQWFDGYRVSFTKLGTVYEVDTAAQQLCVDAATLAANGIIGDLPPVVTVRARSKVATNDDDFDSPPANGPMPGPQTNDPTNDPNQTSEFIRVGYPPKGYVNCEYHVIGDGRDSFVLKGVRSMTKCRGSIGPNVQAANNSSSASGDASLNIYGIALASGPEASTLCLPTELADEAGVPDNAYVLGAVHFYDEPDFALMNFAERGTAWSYGHVWGSGVEEWTTAYLWRNGSQRSDSWFTTGKVRMEIEVTGPVSGGSSGTSVGLLAMPEPTPNSSDNAADWWASVPFPAPGIYVIEVDATASPAAITVRDSMGASIETGELALPSGMVFRFYWTSGECEKQIAPGVWSAGVTIRCNLGNWSWDITPSAGFGGVPKNRLPAVSQWSRKSNDSFSVSSEGRRGPMYAVSSLLSPVTGLIKTSVAHDTGNHRIRFRDQSRSDQQRVGLCRPDHTGPLGVGGDSVSYRNAITEDRYHILTWIMGGITGSASLPVGFGRGGEEGKLNTRPTDIEFELDVPNSRIRVYIQEDPGTPIAGPLRHFVDIPSVPPGAFVGAMHSTGAAFAEVHFTGPRATTAEDW